MKIRRTVVLGFVLLTLLACSLLLVLGVFGLAASDYNDKKSTTDIEVVVREPSGYYHFLVFERFRGFSDLSERYRVAFWVNDQVTLDDSQIAKLAFLSGENAWSADYEKASRPINSSSAVLYFAVSEPTLRSLAAFRIEQVRLVTRSGDFTDLAVQNQENLRDAINAILSTARQIRE